MNESSSYSSHAYYEDSELKKDMAAYELYATGSIGFDEAKALYGMSSKSSGDFE